MRRAAALLAAALLLADVTGCGGDGSEPGAPRGAALVLDFIPNAVHSGIYSAQRRGYYSEGNGDLTIREPGESTDAPRLLEAAPHPGAGPAPRAAPPPPARVLRAGPGRARAGVFRIGPPRPPAGTPRGDGPVRR